jgi:lipopolysaccharide export system permease protein
VAPFGLMRMTRLELYVASCVLRAVLLSAAALVALFSLLEFVDQLGAVGEGRYNLGDALIYALLPVPARALQIAPVAMLLGGLLGLGLLSRQSELVVMQSLGLSAGRIVGAVLKLAIPLVLILFLAAEYLVPPAQALADSLREAAISAGGPSLNVGGFWAQKNNSFLSVQSLRGDIPENINIYSFAPDGSLTSSTHATTAKIQPDGSWILRNVIRETVTDSQFSTQHFNQLSWHSFVQPSEIRLLILPTDALPPLALFNYIGVLDQRHQQATRYRQELWATIGIPFSMLAMILIAAAFVFGSARARGAGQQIVIGGVLGIAFLFIQQITAYLVILLNLNPAPATLALPLLLSAAAFVQFRRLNLR